MDAPGTTKDKPPSVDVNKNDPTVQDKEREASTNDPEDEKPSSPFLEAGENFLVKKVEELLGSPDQDVNEEDEEGNGMVHRMLLAYTDLDLVEQFHAKPKYLEILGLLLQKGININATNRQGETPLHTIARYPGFTDIIKPLLAAGVKVNAKNSKGMTALHMSIVRGLTYNAQTLVEGGADPNLTDSSGQISLHLLVQGKRSMPMLQHLLKCGADPMAKDSGGRTPLHVAAKWGRVEFMRELLICGAKVNDVDNSGQTPLHFAVKGDLTGDATRLLLEYKAHPDCQEVIYKETPILKAIKLGMVDNIEELIKARANLRLPNVAGDTALHVACRCYNMRVWDLLLRNGGDITLNWQGETPIHKVIEGKNKIALNLMKAYYPNYFIGL